MKLCMARDVVHVSLPHIRQLYSFLVVVVVPFFHYLHVSLSVKLCMARGCDTFATHKTTILLSCSCFFHQCHSVILDIFAGTSSTVLKMVGSVVPSLVSFNCASFQAHVAGLEALEVF